MCSHKQALIQWQHFTDNFLTLSGDPFPSCHIPHQSRSPSADTVALTPPLDLEFKQFHRGWIFHGAHNAPCPEGDKRAVTD